MRKLVRMMWLGATVGVLALPLMASGTPGGAATISVPATVAASQWTVAPSTPVSTSEDQQMNAVSCVTSIFCMAASQVQTSMGERPQVMEWNGSTWSPVSTPAPTGTVSSQLYGVSCVSTGWCVFVGYVQIGSTDVPLVETWNGQQVSVAAGPSAPPANSWFDAVSCTSPTSCAAAGVSGPSASSDSYLAQWNGSAWSTVQQPGPSGTFGAVADGVSCSEANACMAVGYIYTDNGQNTATSSAYWWNGSSWIATNPENGANSLNILGGVSCVGMSFCMATGYSESGFGQASSSLMLEWNGTAWTVSPSPNTTTGGGNYVYGISCFSATACTAVGSNYTDSSASAYVTGALSWNGQSWSLTTPPNPVSNTQEVQLLGVDCLTNWTCMAVGEGYSSSDSATHPFATLAPIARSGYRFVASDGGIFTFPSGSGSPAPFLGSMGGTALNAPIVGMAVMPGGDGYYLVASDGGVFSFGSAQFHGSMGGTKLNAPIVGIAVTAHGGGYWLVASDGGIFSFGDAQFYGSTGAIHLNKPVVGMAPVPNGLGYYLVASDGGIFAYPSSGQAAAPFYGSTGSLTLNKPIVGMAVTSAGGYYLVASDGGIFSFPSNGTASPPFLGSMGGMHLNKPVVGMAAVASGYYLVASDGGIFSFPTTSGPAFYGSTGGTTLNKPIVGMTS